MEVNMRADLKNLAFVLEKLYGEEPLTPLLAQVLNKCLKQPGLVFQEIRALTGNDTGELLLLAWDWKLLLPRRSGQCAEWDDRLMRFEPDEYYEMPNIVRWLLEIAVKTGALDVDGAIAELYDQMGEPAYEQMPKLVKEMAHRTKNLCITAAGIHAACRQAGFENRTGAMIAVLKGGGVISPRLKSVSPSENKGAPVYDVHPTVANLF